MHMRQTSNGKFKQKGELPGKYALFIDDKEHALCLEDAK